MTDGAVYGLIASFSAVLLFNYFFTVPYYSLQVDDSNYPITFFIMGITSLITSTITSSEKKSALHARYEADQANAFYELTSSLRDTVSMEEAEKAIVRSFSKTFHVEAAFLPRRSQTDSCVNLQGAEYYAWPILGKEEPYGILYIPAANAEAFDKTQLLLVDSMCELSLIHISEPTRPY